MNKELMNRRTFLKGLGLLTGGAALAACTPVRPEQIAAARQALADNAEPAATVMNGVINAYNGEVQPAGSAEQELVEVATWPTTPESAADTFGGTAEQWQLNGDGGWHKKETDEAYEINPKGYILEGYVDTEPGKRPDCIVSNGQTVSIQGGTIWPASGQEAAKTLFDQQPVSLYQQSDNMTQHGCRAIGFTLSNQ